MFKWSMKSDLCRCCHAEGSFRSLKETYIHEGATEVYNILMKETFGILIPPATGVLSASTYTVCVTCIERLRDAARFKRQVLECEQRFRGFREDMRMKLKGSTSYNDLGKDPSLYLPDEEDSLQIKQEDTTEDLQLTDLCNEGDVGSFRPPDQNTSGDGLGDFYIIYVPETGPDEDLETENTVSYLLTSDCNMTDDPNNLTDTVVKSEPDLDDADCISIPVEEDRTWAIETPRKQLFVCDICNKKCITKRSLANHIQQHLKGKLSRDTSQKTTTKSSVVKFHKSANIKRPVQKDAKRYCCDVCHKFFTLRSSLIKHISVCHSDNPKTKRKFPCHICLREFTEKGNLKRHLSLHAGEKKFSCDICDARFTQKVHLDSHQIVHTKERKFACGVCHTRFLRRTCLENHEAVHHKKKRIKTRKQRMYFCDKCPRSFTAIFFLEKHLANHSDVIPVHSGEKTQYVCDKCSAEFTTRVNFMNHLRTHLSFPCGICSRYFSTQSDLRSHMSVHKRGKRFQCEICHKKFVRRCNLRIHSVIHTGERKFSCDICDKKFIDNSSLNRHSLVHSGDKKFSCDLCPKKYFRKYNLQIHLASHSKKMQ